MRLLKVSQAGGISFTDDLSPDDLGQNFPRYAILSHRWGPASEEVTYRDIKDTNNGRALQKSGYKKIQFCIERVQQEKDLDYFWIDTCCIDTNNQTEQSEAITSMFRWYKNATKCYVFLSDINSRKYDHQGHAMPCGSDLMRSEWFERGWTLQELVAPSVVEFYSSEKNSLGDKQILAREIHERTKIPISALLGTTPLDEFNPAEKLHWAEGRKTTRPEDKWYCLQGMFDVHIVPNYGEGQNYAQGRLIFEICKWMPDRLRQSIASSSSLESEIRTSQKRVLELDIYPHNWRLLLASLSFPDMNTRLSSIEPACRSTCGWLLETPAWKNWTNNDRVDDHHGFFWIYGKPGAGKSTVMKFAYHHAVKNNLNDEIVLCFFFNARGYGLEKSTLGMYRALLHQLLCVENAQSRFADVAIPTDFTNEFYTWTVDSLSSTLHDVILALVAEPAETGEAGPTERKSLRLFIDALDECSDSEVQDMVRWIEDLGLQCERQRGRFHVCFASRHYPTINADLGVQMTLESESGHERDLAKYIQRNLRSKDPSVKIEKIQKEVQEKASGVFLWVSLVVSILNKELKDGRVHTIRKRLQEIPAGLNDLLQDIIQRDCDNMVEFKFCLQLLLFAKRPLSSTEFYLAMLFSTEDDAQGELPDASGDTLSRFILSSSKGLAELTRSKNAPRVQFIHQSVKDYLINENGFLKIWPELGAGFEYTSHDRIRQCCEDYLELVFAAFLQKEMAKRELEKQYPLLDYAKNGILYHAEIAAITVNQNHFLDRFRHLDWVKLHNAFTPHETKRYALNSELSYVLAAEGCVRLIELRDTFDLWARMKSTIQYAAPFAYAFCAALARHDKEIAVALLVKNGVARSTATQLCLPKKGLVSRNTAPLAALCHADNAAIVMVLLARHDCRERQDVRLIRAAMEGGHHGIVDLLFPTVDLRARNHRVQVSAISSILNYICRLGQEDRLRRILSEASGCSLSQGALEDLLYDALPIAVKNSHHMIIKILLRHLATAKSSCSLLQRGTRLSKPLSEAVRLGSTEIVQMLLCHGASVNCGNALGETALVVAVSNGSQSMVEFLLDVQQSVTEASTATETLDSERSVMWVQSSLFAAMSIQNPWIVRILTKRGPLLELCDRSGLWILVYLAWSGVERAMKLLSVNSVQKSVQELLVKTDFVPLWWLYKQKVSSHTRWSISSPTRTTARGATFPASLEQEIRKYDYRCDELARGPFAKLRKLDNLEVLSSCHQRWNKNSQGETIFAQVTGQHQKLEEALKLLETSLNPL